jgi:DNA-directed RNA polymerase subunit F
MRYLEKQYSNLSIKSQKNKLQEILQRLKEFNFLDPETLDEVVQSLLTEETWPMYKVLAHLDMIDHDERT